MTDLLPITIAIIIGLGLGGGLCWLTSGGYED